MNYVNLFYAFSGGFLPTLIWLWFWLKEDPHPEPRRFIFLTFFFGMLAVPLALFLEDVVARFSLWLGMNQGDLFGMGMIIIWATIEEVLKYLAARQAAFNKKIFDEPTDALIYMITAALGFAALENALFLLKAFRENTLLLGLLTGNLRFLGATLLHTVSSGALGASIGFCFFHKNHRHRNLFWGLMLAILLHVFFNFFIIKNSGAGIFQVFSFIWIGTIAVIFIFEKIKRINK